MLLEFFKFFILVLLIVITSKYLLANYIRKIANVANLSSKITGEISGIATSVPEFLSVVLASSVGMVDTGFFNILFSNLINISLFITSTYLSKNFSYLKNKKFIVDYVIIAVTIILPLILIFLNLYTQPIICPIFIILFLLFLRIKQVVYNNFSITSSPEIKVKLSFDKKIKKITYYSFVLLLSCILLYFLGNSLSNSLEILFKRFYIPQFLLGLLLGVFTSIPELITFLSAQKHYKLTNEKRFQGVLESLNNLTMSNIMNLFFIQAIGILIYTIYS